MAKTNSDPSAVPQGSHPNRLQGADAIRLHLTLALGLAICITAFVIEVLRALGGNSLSWTYVFEWPLLAGFALYMWWHLFNGTDRRRPGAAARSAARSVREGGEAATPARDRELEAWNDYLRTLESEDTAGEDPDEG